MTDHPSNPPSQTKGHEIVREWMTAYTSKARLAELIDSALAAQEAKLQRAQKGNLDLAEKLDAQEARHKAAIEGMALALLKATKEGEQSSADARVADAQWKGWMAKAEEAESRLRVSHVQNAVLQREVGLLEETISEQASKLREATEREKVLVEASRNLLDVLRVESRIRSGFPPDNVAIATARGALLAAIRSGPAHPPADKCDGQHGECPCAQHRPNGPPEQGTPKP